MSKLAEKLAERIKKEFGVEVEPIIHRVRAGPSDRSAGAWSWWMQPKDHPQDVGSQWTATEVLKWKKWDVVESIHTEITIIEGDLQL